MEEQTENARFHRFPFKDPEQFGDGAHHRSQSGDRTGRRRNNHPYCCGQQMQVETELMGQDYARCGDCKTTMINAASPYVNGGYVFDDETHRLMEIGSGRSTSRRKPVSETGAP